MIDIVHVFHGKVVNSDQTPKDQTRVKVRKTEVEFQPIEWSERE